MYTFGFIGTGNMGGALAEAACVKTAPASILLSDGSREKAARMAEKLGCFSAGAKEVAEQCRYIFLGVKPQIMATLLAEIAPVLSARRDRFLLVSMAAGVSTDKIRGMTLSDCPIIRIMPNTSVTVGEGMILYTATENVTEGEITEFKDLMSGAGRFDPLPESLIDAGSAVSGCGPAYIYLLIEALADGGVACGLPRDKAMAYAAQTALGAAKAVLETGIHPGELKDRVCSPGGSTIAGVLALEAGGFRAAAAQAVIAAYKRTVELGK